MKVRALVFATLLVQPGCSAEVSQPVDPIVVNDAGLDPVLLFADGSPCDFDAQCTSNTCIGSKNPKASGRCFSIEFNGCLVVTEPSPFKKLCNGSTQILFTCGDAFDAATEFANCEFVGAGKLLEYYHCCPMP
jgi:hypothetical protein